MFFAIAPPLVRSGLAATFMLVFIPAWNEFLLALFLTNAKAQTMSVLIVIMIAPVIVARGLLIGAVKGAPDAGEARQHLEVFRIGGNGQGFNLEVQDEEFRVLLGASGSGKTTALRMIAGLVMRGAFVERPEISGQRRADRKLVLPPASVRRIAM